jgi:hypothetical protein
MNQKEGGMDFLKLTFTARVNAYPLDVDEQIVMSNGPKFPISFKSMAAAAFGRAVIALASLATFGLPASPHPQLDPEDVMVEKFQSVCVVYYTRAQCVGAVRFILRTSGSEYFVYLENDESPDSFLGRLAAAVEGGEALRASEMPRPKVGD